MNDHASNYPDYPTVTVQEEQLIDEAVKKVIEQHFKYYVLEQGVIVGEFDTKEEAIQYIEESDSYKPVSVILGKELNVKQSVQLELDL